MNKRTWTKWKKYDNDVDIDDDDGDGVDDGDDDDDEYHVDDNDDDDVDVEDDDDYDDDDDVDDDVDNDDDHDDEVWGCFWLSFGSQNWILQSLDARLVLFLRCWGRIHATFGEEPPPASSVQALCNAVLSLNARLISPRKCINVYTNIAPTNIIYCDGLLLT